MQYSDRRIRVPWSYHSGSIESSITAIKGIKVVYPSNAADMKGLLKGATTDPNPVIMFEHKGLYWSKVPCTQAAKKLPDPADDYIIPVVRPVSSACGCRRNRQW